MRRGGLFLKYAVPLVILSSGAAASSSGLVEIYFSYQENKAALARVQREKAIAAAARIEQFVRELEHQLAWIAQTPWGPRGVPLDQRRLDSLRLLRHAPAVTEVSHLDPTGHEQLRVSRLAMDVVGSNADFSQDPQVQGSHRAQDLLQPGLLPQGVRAVHDDRARRQRRGCGRRCGRGEPEVHLGRGVQSKVGKGGYAYVVDAQGRLIAHPDISLVLQKTDLSALPQVRRRKRSASRARRTCRPRRLVGRDLQWPRGAVRVCPDRAARLAGVRRPADLRRPSRRSTRRWCAPRCCCWSAWRSRSSRAWCWCAGWSRRSIPCRPAPRGSAPERSIIASR